MSCRSGNRAPWIILALAAASLVLVQACAQSRPPTKSSVMLTAEAGIPPEIAATLTAWPTPPPIITRPPTTTPLPVSLWTSAPATEVRFPAAQETSGPALGSSPDSAPPAVRIRIPVLGLDVPVVEVGWTVVLRGGSWRSEWETAGNAAGHLRGTANPGEANNMVISGHHNTKGEVFRPLSDVGLPGNPLKQGDDIVVVAESGTEYTYQVVLWDRFLEEGASPAELQRHVGYLGPSDNAKLTLVTCWPYESNTHRVVIVAHLAP